MTTSGAPSVRVDAMESTVPKSLDAFADKANELAMSFDLTVDEARRDWRSDPSALVHRKGAWRCLCCFC